MPAQLTRAEVKQLYAEGKYDEIEKARVAGRLDLLLGVDPDLITASEQARSGTITGDQVRRLAAAGRHGLVETARQAGRITP